MRSRRYALTLATAVIAGAVALAASPAIAQGTPQATIYTFSFPGSIAAGSDKFSLPGDLVTKKSRGSRDLGKTTLADMVVTINRQAAKGHSVTGLVTIGGNIRHMRGLPVLTEDGKVKIRVAQGRGSRTLVLPRKYADGATIVCPYPSVVVQAGPGRYRCSAYNP